ncbi:MAG: hypothetical protein ACLU62_03710 [Hydrogeniiclostridium sp.]
MEELDMIRWARQYLEALSSGTDPIGKKPISQGETLLQPRLSRCFRYVAELLGEFEREPSLLEHLVQCRNCHTEKKVENPSPKTSSRQSTTRPEKKEGKGAELSREAQEKGVPLSLNRLAETLRPLLGENSRMALEASEITEWLLLSGYLKHITRETDGAHRIIPTEKGEKLGITRVERIRQDGKPYHFNLYSTAAQEFIRQHLEEILSQSSKRLFLEGPYRHPL